MDDEATATPFTRQLRPDEGDALRARARPRVFRPGATIVAGGDVSDQLAIIASGRAKISYFTEDGREIVLAVRGPGDLLGELSVLDRQPRSASAIAMEEVEALVVAGDDFRAFLQEKPRVALLLLEMLARRLRDADSKRIEFGAQDVVGRVARRLVELAERFGQTDAGGVRINLPLSQQELAGWTGASREAVSKALQALRNRRWIETHRRGITVVDMEGLRRRAT